MKKIKFLNLEINRKSIIERLRRTFSLENLESIVKENLDKIKLSIIYDTWDREEILDVIGEINSFSKVSIVVAVAHYQEENVKYNEVIKYLKEEKLKKGIDFVRKLLLNEAEDFTIEGPFEISQEKRDSIGKLLDLKRIEVCINDKGDFSPDQTKAVYFFWLDKRKNQ